MQSKFILLSLGFVICIFAVQANAQIRSVIEQPIDVGIDLYSGLSASLPFTVYEDPDGSINLQDTINSACAETSGFLAELGTLDQDFVDACPNLVGETLNGHLGFGGGGVRWVSGRFGLTLKADIRLNIRDASLDFHSFEGRVTVHF